MIFLAQIQYSNAIYPFALRRLPTVELCSPCGEVPWSITAVNRRARDSSLRRVTKHTARAVGHSMAGSVAAERHLWLILTEIREKEKVFLLDAPISQSGLFGEAVSSVVDKFCSAKTQSAALKQFMPRRLRDYSTPSSLSREQSLPRKEPSGGSGAQAAHPPPTTVWGARASRG